MGPASVVRLILQSTFVSIIALLPRLGALICGENTNTLARFALLAQGEQVHIATYPPAWPTRRPGASQNYNLTEAIRIRSAAHAFEGKVFNVVASCALDMTNAYDLRHDRKSLDPDDH